MKESNKNIICLTPTKNEEWIIKKFLTAVSLWADYIIVADQGSTDNTVEIAENFEKVRVIKNTTQVYDESHRQKILIDEARKIDGDNILFALDTDEFITSNFIDSVEWKTILNAEKGTTIRMRWVHISPCFNLKNDSTYENPVIFIDDRRSSHKARQIHSYRVPFSNREKVISLNEIKLLHFSEVYAERAKSKKNFYKCFELINGIHNAQILNIKYNVPVFDKSLNKSELFEYYLKNDIDLTSVNKRQIAVLNEKTPYDEKSDWIVQDIFWWDQEVLKMFNQYGINRFALLDIWDYNWAFYSKYFDIKIDLDSLHNPKNRLNKKIKILLHKLSKELLFKTN